MNLLDQLMDTPMPPLEERVWSDYQNGFFSKVETTDESIQLEAVAGSGKSTTLCHVPNLVQGNVVFLAFMKSNVEDLKGRVTNGEVRTFNSLGHGQLFGLFRNVKIDGGKLWKLLPQVASRDITNEFGGAIVQSVNLAKNDAIGLESEPTMWDFYDVIQRHDLDVPEEMCEQVAEFGRRLLAASVADLSCFDYNDQLYVPLLRKTIFPAYNTIIVDEDQDLSPIQHLMLEQLKLRVNGRIIGAGDRRQAIYAFRGALANSVDLLKSRFQMLEAPLSISYRCARAIVEEAKKYCPQIEARPGAPEGEILTVKEDPEFWDPDQMVLCRTNAPLFRAILRYVRARRPCRVKSNFLEQMEGMVRRFKARTKQQFEAKLEEWYTTEKSYAERKGQKSKIMLLKDKYETLKLLSDQVESPYQISALLKQLADSKIGTIFSTIHKAKGLEADRVHILRPDLMPAPWVEPEDAEGNPTEEYQQELNMLYVGITRAKLQLVYGARRIRE